MVVVIGILMFMVLILSHELGHFITAKKNGVKVLEFGIGIPPKVCKLRTDKSGTEYTLNLIPLGGFVRLKGENPDIQEDFHAKDSFIKAKIWKKIIILLAGITSNVILAWILFTVIFTAGTRPIVITSENSIQGKQMSYLFPTKTFLYQKWYITDAVKKQIENIPVVIQNLESWEIADTIGIKQWDKILTINNLSINAWNMDTLLKNMSWWLVITAERKYTTYQFTWTCENKNCTLGIAYSGIDISDMGIFKNQRIKFSLGKSMKVAAWEILSETKSTFSILGTLGKSLISFQKTKISKELNKMTWPVGAVKIWWMLYDEWWWTFFIAFAAMISLALAIFNVLPIPALDGGRLLGVLIQWIGKLKPEKYFTIESYINLIFFVLLMGLGIYIILKDLVRFRQIKIPFIG